MEKIRIDTGKLKRTSETIDGEIAKAERLVTLIENTGARMGQMWEGEAKAALQTVFIRDINVLKEACKMLHRIPGYEEFASDSYEDCETEVADRLAGAGV